MQKRNIPKSLLSLTSEQIGESLSKGFWGFLDSSKKLYREDLSIDINLINRSSIEDRVPKKVVKHTLRKYSLADSGDRPDIKRKGHVPIRSQTGHDHDRGHQKS